MMAALQINAVTIWTTRKPPVAAYASPIRLRQHPISRSQRRNLKTIQMLGAHRRRMTA